MLPPARHLLRARDLIDARYAEPLDVAALARAAAASRAHFSRGFARTFGSTPHRYLRARRIERAQHLLRSTDLPVLEIAPAVGFASAASFSTAFTRIAGVTPSAYRRRATPDRLAAVPTCVVMAASRAGAGEHKR